MSEEQGIAQEGLTGEAPAEEVGAAPEVNWMEGLSEEDAELVNSRHWEDPSRLIKSYRELESFRGVPADKLLKLPDPEDADAMGEVYNKLGRPTTPDDYDIQGENIDQTRLEWFKPVAHELGLSQSQAAKLAELDIALGEQMQQQMQEQQALQLQEQVQGLKKEWGAAFDDRMSAVDRVTAQFNISEEEVTALRNSLGVQKAANLLYGLNTKLGEPEHLTGEGSSVSGAMTPGGAKQRISELKMDDKFMGKYMSGDSNAISIMDNLMKQSVGA